MSQPVELADSSIVMAEQSSHDVVKQTLSGGEPSPSDVPASTNDKTTAGGDVGDIENTVTTAQTDTHANTHQPDSRRPQAPVPTRALELNGVGSGGSDGGEDSQGGSESDASRTDGRHTRTGSSKKPTTFKPVSFAKFSVPKAPGTAAPPKVSDKASLSSTTPLGAPQPSSRPRLVAKTTSSLRDSLSKNGAGGIKPGGTGPDPNQVWNKNRPVQPTPPKHLTDEELKQQYGIHMTSRIQEDGGGTEAKWADIDDDEDDWAPETIEWTDGTKVTLTHTETAPPSSQDTQPSKEPKSISPPPEQATAGETTKIVPKPTTSIGPNPTVLRLGANAERQAKSASVSSRGTSDRPPSASTSPAPVPSKSPWAPLPPVEKASPILPPVQVQPPSRVPFREPQPNDGFNAPSPPKEIAADDFNRTWREGQSGAPRELYNSRSGRYEPVSETRKGTWRNDQTFRTPAVLQRPPHGDQTGPAEPSAAFQTHRSTGQDGTHWTRRRTSSNVSGGSGSFGRRMSIGRPDAPPRYLEMRRGSQVNGMVDPSVPARDLPHPKEPSMRSISPTRQVPAPTWQQRPPAEASNMTNQPTTSGASEEPAPAPPVFEEDPVVVQERIMKEKRLEARKRRIEQEEREEAAKRERIRLKLEALGPVPEKPKAKPESNKPEAPTATAPATTSQSPPKPPVPEPTGEPKQYGMMKVHHPESVKKLVAANERAAEKSAPAPHVRRVPSPVREPKVDTTITNGLRQPHDSQTHVHDKHPEPKVDDKGPHWRNNLNVSGPYSPWSANSKLGGTSSSVANPWKPLSIDKTLGNGIFDQTLGGFPGRDLPLRGHLGLDQPPIGPSLTGDRLGGSQSFTSASRAPQESASISPLPSPDIRHATYESLNPIARPGPIGPPSSQHSQWQQDPRRGNEKAGWNKFHPAAAMREADEHERIIQEMDAMRDIPSAMQATFSETWKRVGTDDHAGPRQVMGIASHTESGAPASNPLPGFDHSVSGLPFSEPNNSRPFGSVSVRGSRFFPHPPEQTKKPAVDEEYPRSPSPPPPEEVSSHPVFTGDSHRPLVHLPAPKPIVKLPPNIAAQPPPPPTFASMAAAPPPSRLAGQPVLTAASWQEKINGLFGKKTVTEKKTALAVSSASKEPLDVQLHIAAVSVSLPQNAEGELQIGDGEVASKQVEEVEEMFEDREVGSLPVVRVPNMAPPAAWNSPPRPSQSRLRSKNLKPMQVHSIEPYSFGFFDRDTSGNIRISIRFPGAVPAKTLILPKKTGSHAPRPRNSSNFKPRKNTNKPREGTGNFNSNKKQASSQANGSASSPRHQSRNASWGPRTFSGPH